MTYNSGVLLVQVAIIMLFDALLATKEDVAIAQILLLPFDGATHGDSLHLIRGVVWVLWVHLRVGAHGFMTDETEGIDLNLFALDESS